MAESSPKMDSKAPSKYAADNLPKNGETTTIANIDIDSEAEKALVWKFDLRILPVLSLMYLFNSLDKSNLGNAKTAGLEGWSPHSTDGDPSNSLLTYVKT